MDDPRVKDRMAYDDKYTTNVVVLRSLLERWDKIKQLLMHVDYIKKLET